MLKRGIGFLIIGLVALSGRAASSAIAEEQVWNAGNGFRGMMCMDGVVGESGRESYKLTITGRDCKVSLVPPAPFPTAGADTLVIRYRAKGTGPTGGQFYYARGAERFSDARCWRLPPMKADGEWHDMVLGASALTDRAGWFDDEPVTRFRYDPTDSPGGTVEIAEVRFRAAKSGKSVAKPQVTTAADRELYDADLWPDVESEVWKCGPADGKNADCVGPVVGLGGTAEPQTAKAGEPVTFRYDFRGPLPALPFEAALVFRCGESIRWKERIRIREDEVERFASERWRITVKRTMPLYLSSCEMRVSFETRAFYRNGGSRPSTDVAFKGLRTVPGFDRPVTAGVVEVGGTPRFAVNGKPIYALWGTVWERDGNVRHSSAPLNVVTIWNQSQLVWKKENEFDPSNFDYQAELHRRAHPDAWFIMDLTFYLPQDWADRNPDDLARDEKGRINHDDGDVVNASFASKKAMDALERTIERSIRYLEGSPYANRIIGYRINSGHTAEWLGWDPSDRESVLDFSPVAQKGFETFARSRYPSVTDFSVPTLAERRALDGDELLWDPVRHMRAIAYHDFYSNAVADDVIRLCRRAKDLVGGKKLIGTYHGYVMTLFGSANNQMRAHFAAEKVIESGAIDFIVSPQPYAVRNPGDTRGDMKPFKSIQNHGIVSVIEDDTRTFNSRRTPNAQMPTEWLSTAIMRRNMAIALCRNEPFYTYALCAGTEFDYPAFAADAATVRRVGEYCLERGVCRMAEIAVVVSEEAMKAMPMLKGQTDRYPVGWQGYGEDASGRVVRTDQSGAVTLGGYPYVQSWTQYARIGAPVDYLLAEDLKHGTGNYRLYVFNCCTKADPALVAAAAELRKRDCTVVWLYAPGYVSGTGNSTANMKALTGIDFEKCAEPMDPGFKAKDGRTYGSLGRTLAPLFRPLKADSVWGTYPDGTPGFAAVRTGKALSVFSGTYRLEVPVLRRLAKRAGVHLYSDSSDPVEANDSLFTLHARFAGRKTVRLPRKTTVVDVFNRRIVARRVDSFDFEAPLHSSWLFYCADDAESLLGTLK